MSSRMDGGPFSCAGESWATVNLTQHPGFAAAIDETLAELQSGGEGVFTREDAVDVLLGRTFPLIVEVVDADRDVA